MTFSVRRAAGKRHSWRCASLAQARAALARKSQWRAWERGNGLRDVVRYLLLVLSTLGLLVVSAAAHAQEAGLPLVHVYCAEISHLAKAGETLSDEAWQALVARLEKRELRASEVGAGVMEDCVRENSEAFERAEFVLRGAQLLDEALKSFNGPSAAVAPKPELATLGVPGLETLVVPTSEPAPSEGEEWRREAEERRHHYSELWHDFLNDLRRKLTASVSLPRVTANLKQ